MSDPFQISHSKNVALIKVRVCEIDVTDRAHNHLRLRHRVVRRFCVALCAITTNQAQPGLWIEFGLWLAYKRPIRAVCHASLGPGYQSDCQLQFPSSLV
jgi:hypothetical protein